MVQDSGRTSVPAQPGLPWWLRVHERLRRRGARVVTVGVWVILSVCVLVLLAPRANLPSHNIVQVELAGTSDRAWHALGVVYDPACDDGSYRAQHSCAALASARHDLHRALAWDLPFIAGYSAILLAGLFAFPRWSYRVTAWRQFYRTALLLVAIGAALDLLEDAALLVGASAGDAWPWWGAAATVAWPKFIVLGIVVGYVMIAAGTYVTTPVWMQPYLYRPPSPTSRSNGDLPDDSSGSSSRQGTDDPKAVQDMRPVPVKQARFGIAVSGGGVRSSTLTLGGLQGLHDEYGRPDANGPSWNTADKVTSVSGGSYAAGAWSIGRSARRPASAGEGVTVPPENVEAWKAGSLEEAHLMDHLGFLVSAKPAGDPGRQPGNPPDVKRVRAAQHSASDLPGAVSTLVLGLTLNVAVLFSLLWLVVRPYAWLTKSWAVGCSSYQNCRVHPYTYWPALVWLFAAVVMLVCWVAAGWVRASWPEGSLMYRSFNWLFSHLRPVTTGLFALAAILLLVLVAAPFVVGNTPGWVQDALSHATVAAVVSGVGAVLSVVRGLSASLTRFAPLAAAVLLAILVVLTAAVWVAQADWTSRDRWTWLILLASWLALYSVASPEWWSLAPFYRGKLRTAFATFRDTPADGTEIATNFLNGNAPADRVEPSLYEYKTRGEPDVETAHVSRSGSPLRICGTAAVSGRAIKTHNNLPGMSITMGPDHVRLHVPISDEGRWQAHDCPTRRIEQLMYRTGGARFTTMMAVGISGAAVAPAMGKFKLGPAYALVALLNLRLGVWVPNPIYARLDPAPAHGGKRPSGPSHHVKYPRVRIGYLIKEVFGVFDANDPYLYLTDGGHWDNTGLVELVREHDFDEVVCFDADASPRNTVEQLASAIVLAKLECGVEIDIDLDPLRSPPNSLRGEDYSSQSVAVGVIRRRTPDGEQRGFGLLWYAKPVLTKVTPPGLLSYAEIDAKYPSAGTSDLFYDTAKFTAYRDLGRHNAKQVAEAREELESALAQCPTKKSFEDAAKAKDAHWAVRSAAALLEEGEYDALKRVFRVPEPATVRSHEL